MTDAQRRRGTGRTCRRCSHHEPAGVPTLRRKPIPEYMNRTGCATSALDTRHSCAVSEASPSRTHSLARVQRCLDGVPSLVELR